MKRIMTLALVVCLMASMNITSNAAMQYNKESKSSVWWVSNDGNFLEPITGICNLTIFEDATFGTYPTIYLNSSSTFSMIDWPYANNMYITANSKLKFYSGSLNTINVNLTRDYNVLTSPSWEWKSYRNDNQYQSYVSSNGFSAKSTSYFTVLEALTPTWSVNCELVLY